MTVKSRFNGVIFKKQNKKKMNYRTEIQKILNAKNISRRRFCVDMGVNTTYFTNVINGVKNLTPRLAAQLEIYGIGSAKKWGEMMIEEQLTIQKKKYAERI